MFAYAGFLKLTNEAIGKQAEANTIFQNVALGLIVLLAAWLVVDTLMKSVLGGDFGPWNDICRAIGM
jgi:ABC-type nickel/cobalt efflux system permease component RcnA